MPLNKETKPNHLDGTVIDSTIPSQSNNYERVLHIRQSSRTGALPSYIQ